MNKILIASLRISGSALAKKIAEDEPQVTVHYMGNKIEGNLPSNLLYIGEYINPRVILALLKEIHHEYDFIYAVDFPLQFSVLFQEWKKSVTTPILCASRECCFLEFSKLKFKKILNELSIPNSEYELIVENDWGNILDLSNPEFINAEKFVVKIDKTFHSGGFQTRILNAQNYKEHVYGYRYLGETYFVEKFIKGIEMSAHFLCNGSKWVYLGSARDYKKLFENDEGQNCSSTGCYSPVEYVTDDIKSQMFGYVDKILEYLNSKGVEYKGIMYLGLIIDENNIVNVLELNARPGNPEFNTILNTLGPGILRNLYNAAMGLPLIDMQFTQNAAVSANLISKNYAIEQIGNKQIPKLIIDESVTVCYFSKAIHYSDNIFANVLKTGDNISKISQDLHSYLEKQELGDYRIRRDIGKLI